MQTVPDNFETLMVRRLDGTIGEDDELTLDRELIRNPEARRLQDEFQRIDGLASAALNEAFSGVVKFDVDSLPIRRSEPRRVSFWTRWMVPGAVAAGLLAWALARVSFDRPAVGPAPMADRSGGETAPLVPRISPGYGPGEMRYNAALGRPSVKRDTGREVIGVMGEDGNLYWIEVDRTRTVRRPGDVRF